MESLIKEAGTLIGSIGTYARLIVVGVWFPGFLIFCELGSCYFRLFYSVEKTLFGYIAATIQSFNSTVVTTLIVVSVVATSIALGYVARDIAFAISDLWLRRQWKPTRKLSDIYKQIRMVYGEERVDNTVADYGVFRLVSATGSMDRLPRMPESYVREFCKQWLRMKAPALNTEGLEIEINMLMGLVVPIALFSTVVICFIGSWLGIALAALSIAAAAFMMYRINWARNIETEQAIVNFLFAHWERLNDTPA
jgi:hypothetical protein